MKNWLKFIGLCYMVLVMVQLTKMGFTLGYEDYGIFPGLIGIIFLIVSLLSVRWFYNQYLGKCPICKRDGIPRKSIKCPYCQSFIK